MDQKPGYQTTEFMLTIANTVGALALALSEVVPSQYALLAMVVSNVAYSFARSWVKRQPAPPVVPAVPVAPVTPIVVEK